MKTNTSIETWIDAIGKMSGDPFIMLGTNTPSIDQPIGTNYSEYYQKVLTGEFTDDSAFAFIARTDEGDQPHDDESVWPKSLPALGVTFPIENIRKMVETARYDVSRRLRLERLYFGIPVGSAGFWMDVGAWSKCRKEIDPDAMRGRRLHLALDLSKKNDLTALSGAWEATETEKMAVKNWFWTVDGGIDKRTAQDRIPYRELEADGELTILKSRTVDYKFVAAQVQQICAAHDVVHLVCDAAYISEFMDGCADIGFDCWMYEGENEPEGVGLKIVRHKQGGQIAFPSTDKNTGEKSIPNWLDMPHSIEKTIDAILEENVLIDNGRLTTICASNAVLRAGAQDNQYFDKERSRGRIDGIVTTAMSIGSALSDMNQKQASFSMFVLSS